MPYSPETKWKFYQGDRETAIAFWSGPTPADNQRSVQNFRGYLDRTINTYNIIRELVLHYSNALVSKPFSFQENEILTQWLHTQRRLSAFRKRQNPFTEAVTQSLVSGRSFLRLYTPEKYQRSQNEYLRVTAHLCHLTDSEPEYDSDGFLERFIYTYKDSKGTQKKEEYFVDENGMTHILSQGEEIIVDRNGMLPIFELSLDPVISDAAICAQRSITMLMTMLNEHVASCALREHIITNGQMPGEIIQDPDAPGGERFVERQDLLELGANRLLWLEGRPIGDPNEPSGYTNPQVYFHDPSNPEVFRTALDILLETIYREVGLGHLLVSGDGSISGVSRITLKADFELRAGIYKAYIEEFYNAILEYALMELGESDPMVETQLILDTGDPLPEERKAYLEEFNSGVRSRRSTMQMIGIKDPSSEEKQIRLEQNQDVGMDNVPNEELVL